MKQLKTPWKLIILFAFMIVGIGIVTAIDFTPQGNINLRGLYNITGLNWIGGFKLGGNINASGWNITNAETISANKFIGDGSQLTGIPGGNASWNQSLTDSIYYSKTANLVGSNKYNITNFSTINEACYVMKNNASDIQAKINTCSYVIIPGGTYALTTPINISKSGLTIRGYSQYTNINCSAITSEPCIKTKDGSRYYNLELYNLNIYGDHSNQVDTIGLDITNLSACRFDSLTISGFDRGIYGGSKRGGSSSYSYYNNFYNCNIAGNNVNIELTNHTNENRFIGGYSTGSDSNITLIISGVSDNNQFIGYSFEGDSENISLEGGSWQNGFFGCRMECNDNCYLIFNSNGNSWFGGLITANGDAGYFDNGVNNVVIEGGKIYNSGYVTSTGTTFNMTYAQGYLKNLQVNSTINANIFTGFTRSGSAGYIIIRTNNPTSVTTGRVIVSTYNGSNSFTDRITVGNYQNMPDIDITNARLDLNNNNLTGANTINSTYFVGDGSQLTNVPGTNGSWNESYASTKYLGITDQRYNESGTIAAMNSSWLSTYNSTYATWAYNQTSPAITDVNNRFWNRTQSYNKTEIDNMNSTWSSTYNATYAGYATSKLDVTDQRYNDTGFCYTNFYNKSADVNLGSYNLFSTGNLYFNTSNGYLTNLYVNYTIRSNIYESWTYAGSAGDLIVRTQSPTSQSTGRIILQTRDGTNTLVNRILIENYKNISDIDILLSRLDLNSNNISNADYVTANNLVGNLDASNVTNVPSSWTSTYNATYDAKVTDNSSWSESYANNKYLGITDQRYNESGTITTMNSSWLSTYNSTYATWAYNQTAPAITDANNRFWNKTQAYNKTEIDNLNSTWSSTYNSTYAQWSYNQTTAANSYTDTKVGTSNLHQHDATNITNVPSSWLTTYNATYDAYSTSKLDVTDQRYNDTGFCYSNFYNKSSDLNLGSYDLYSNGTLLNFTYATGYIKNINVNGTFKTNIIENWNRNVGTDSGDLIIRTNSPTSATIGRIILRTLNSTNGWVNRILIENYKDTADIDVTNARLDMNNNNITGVNTINATYFVGDGSQLTGVNGDNASFNESYTNTKYASIIWNYNQTTATYDLYNGAWSSTYNATYAAKADYNTVTNYNTTGNVTANFHCLTQNCAHRMYYNGSATIIE